MNPVVLELSAALVLGGILGAVYFLSLWRTVRRLPVSDHPARLMIVGFLLRMALALTGFYLIMAGDWRRAAAAAVGFLAARYAVAWSLRPASGRLKAEGVKK
jgi:F1F0 ATPase subunit 2